MTKSYRLVAHLDKSEVNIVRVTVISAVMLMAAIGLLLSEAADGREGPDMGHRQPFHQHGRAQPARHSPHRIPSRAASNAGDHELSGRRPGLLKTRQGYILPLVFPSTVTDAPLAARMAVEEEPPRVVKIMDGCLAFDVSATSAGELVVEVWGFRPGTVTLPRPEGDGGIITLPKLPLAPHALLSVQARPPRRDAPLSITLHGKPIGNRGGFRARVRRSSGPRHGRGDPWTKATFAVPCDGEVIVDAKPAGMPHHSRKLRHIPARRASLVGVGPE